MVSSHLLLGVHAATLDPEGRIQLPVALRDEWNLRRADFRLMANLEPDGSLCLRERERWDDWVAALRRRPALGQRERRTLLFLAAHSAPVRCDKSGRVRIPDALLGSIGADRTAPDRREVVLVGGFDEVRVWSPDDWSRFGAETRAEYGDGVDALLARGGMEPTDGDVG